MGHDITAYRATTDERKALHEVLDLENFDAEDWTDKYDRYKRETEAAYLRRAAWNPLNQIIYMALDREQFNAGVSGCGASGRFNRQQLEAALRWLNDVKDSGLENLTRRTNMMDELMVALTGQQGQKTVPAGATIQDEINFVEDCLAYLDESGAKSIEIEFG